MGEWQPIASAPFDMMILLYDPRMAPSVSVGACAEDVGWLMFEYDMMASNCRPTHWQPLPPPPAPAPNGGE